MTAPEHFSSDRERLSAWLDGELSPEETRTVLARLESDPAFLREAEELRRVWDLLGRYPDEPVPEGFADAVLSRARAEGGDGVPAQAPSPVEGAPAPTVEQPPLRVLAGGGRGGRIAAAAAVVLALGVGAVVVSRGGAAPRDGGASAALEALPAEAVENLSALAALSDAEFEAILTSDPEELARLLDEAQGG
jgi:anti-sigma factor RsiW